MARDGLPFRAAVPVKTRPSPGRRSYDARPRLSPRISETSAKDKEHERARLSGPNIYTVCERSIEAWRRSDTLACQVKTLHAAARKRTTEREARRVRRKTSAARRAARAGQTVRGERPAAMFARQRADIAQVDLTVTAARIAIGRAARDVIEQTDLTTAGDVQIEARRERGASAGADAAIARAHRFVAVGTRARFLAATAERAESAAQARLETTEAASPAFAAVPTARRHWLQRSPRTRGE